LGDDVVAVADEMEDGRTEGGAVEGERFARVLNPQLRLDAGPSFLPRLETAILPRSVGSATTLGFAFLGEGRDGVATSSGGEGVAEVGVERAALEAAGLVDGEQPFNRAFAALGAAAE
jgi:hypothetical protein